MDVRRLARRYLPAEILLCRKVLARRMADRRARLRFAAGRGSAPDFPFEWACYQRPFIDYPGQQVLGRAKRKNQALLASFLDGVVVEPGEVFSVWRLAPLPNAKSGFKQAAALRNGVLTTEEGGAICLLSTVLYNAALLAGMDILERHCHSVDSYGQQRYFELGRDAAIEYGYLDLRLRNPHPNPLLLRIEVSEAEVTASLLGTAPKEFSVSFDISEPAELPPLAGDAARYRVRTFRVTSDISGSRREDLGWSTHRVPADGGAIRMPANA